MNVKKEFLNQKAVLYSAVNESGLLHPPVFLEGSIVLILQENVFFKANSFTEVKMGIRLSIPYGYFLQMYLKQMLHAKYRLMLSNGVIIKNSFKREVIVTIWNPTSNDVTLDVGVPLLTGYLSRIAFAISQHVYEERMGKKVNFSFIE